METVNDGRISSKEAVLEAIKAGMTCPEASDKYGIPRASLYHASYVLGMQFPSAVERNRKRKAELENARYKVSYDDKSKEYVIILKDLGVVFATTRISIARDMALRLNSGELAIRQ